MLLTAVSSDGMTAPGCHNDAAAGRLLRQSGSIFSCSRNSIDFIVFFSYFQKMVLQPLLSTQEPAVSSLSGLIPSIHSAF